MALVKVERRSVTFLNGSYHPLLPKPTSFRRRILIEVCDEVFLTKNKQQLYDVFFKTIGSQELIGLTPEEIQEKHSLQLLFHLESLATTHA